LIGIYYSSLGPFVIGKFFVKIFSKCADGYEVSEILENMGIIVKYTGLVLTEFLKDENIRVITV